MTESRFLEVKREMGGTLHLRLNIPKRLIGHKYREGKLKRTSKGGLKNPEIADMEATVRGLPIGFNDCFYWLLVES